MSIGEDLDELELIQKEGDELFLDLIKERECLWNKGCKQYHLVDWKDNAMQEVAAILGDTGMCRHLLFTCYNNLIWHYLFNPYLQQCFS